MKTAALSKLLATAAAITAVLWCAVAPAVAQTTPPGGGAGNPAAALQRIKESVGQLDLTDTQKEQVDKIFKQASDDITNAAPDLQNASPEDKAGKYREILSDLRDQVGGVLSDDQKQQLYQKMQALRQGAQATATTLPITPPSTQPTARLQPAAGGGGKNGGGKGGRGMQMLQHFRDALAQLDLTDDEKKQTDDVLNDMAQQLKQMRQSVQAGTMSREDVRGKIAAVLQDAHTKMSGILTPDQQQKLRTIMQQSAGPSDTPRANSQKSDSPPAMPSSTAPAPYSNAQPAPLHASVTPDIGQPAPDFQLKLLNGDTTSISAAKHKVLVLTFASATAPVFRDHAAGLNALHDKYGSRGVQFLVIYTKEQHPAGGWELQRNKDDKINIPLAKTTADRTTAAEQLHNALQLGIPIATDSMTDQTAAAYGVNQTVPAFVIDRDGNIAFHQSWLEPDSLGRAIDDALAAVKK